MNKKISVVINTFNEARDLERVLRSVGWADEVVVCDMHSTDDSVKVAKKNGARVILHKWVNFVEPVRNFTVEKTSGDWILVLDPDEEVSETLAKKLKEIVSDENADYVEIPRKNIIFNKWIQASNWWPDYKVRFFKKGKVRWSDKIHVPPQIEGEGLKLPPEEGYALNHYHYQNISQFLTRLNRYTDVQADELQREGVKFQWTDLIRKPLGEFLGRYFAEKGFSDGLHGFALSLLQAFSFLIVYLKLWEKENFPAQDLSLTEVKKLSQDSGKEISYWFKYGNLSSNSVERFLQKVINKIS